MEKGLKRKTFCSSDLHICLFRSHQAAAFSQRGLDWPVLYVLPRASMSGIDSETCKTSSKKSFIFYYSWS